MNRALIVDDNAENLYLLESILRGSGFEVLCSKNGSEALELAKREMPDIIISDILMPVMDGFEFCRKCKEDYLLKQIPFIFYTATYTEPKDEEFALSLGADRFIIKPQKPDMLEKVIRETLEESRQDGSSLSYKPLGEEAEFLRLHNEVLFSKLEHKVAQLENEITNRKLAEKKITKLNNELEARVKERTLQLENALQELESFSYSVSHDLKTPLRHISSFAEMLKNEYNNSLDIKGSHYLDAIVESSEKMKHLIDDLLYFSRMSHSELVKKKIDLNLLVEDVLKGFEIEKQGRDINFTVLSLPEVSADSSMIRIVFQNLISNAIKFTSKTDHAIIKIGVGEDSNDYIMFIQDNGAGFDMAYSSKLFGVFRRLHSGKDYEGTGIGLAIVRQIIKRHGGKTWAEGEPDKGAVFYFTLPKNEVENG